MLKRPIFNSTDRSKLHNFNFEYCLEAGGHMTANVLTYKNKIILIIPSYKI